MLRSPLAALVLLALAACGSEAVSPPAPEPAADRWDFRATAEGFVARRGAGGYAPFLPIGVNFGLAVPGTFPGEFAASRAQIARWIAATADLGANVIRIYTVQSPAFYQELRRHNLAHPDRPLFLLQGAWLIEPEAPPFDYLADEVVLWFRDEIERVVDVVHGNRVIPEAGPDRPENYGRATGVFDADVSPWLLGYLIGREVEPYTLESTYALHPDARSYAGTAFSVEDGDPIEPFIAEAFDYLVAWEAASYGAEHPIGFSNWPTLDPLTHPTEPEWPVSSEDEFAIDMKRIAVDEAHFTSGVFISYHAYPYYPEFVMYDPGYQVEDEAGLNPYLGYLRDLRAWYEGYTLIVGEIGLPSSQGSAHAAPSGLDHGGLDEREQGHGMVRTLGNVLDAGLDGAFLFALVDEWWKRTWIVDPIELPAERRRLWFNPMSPEQNFGLIAMRPGPAERYHFLDGEDDEWSTAPQATGGEGPLVPIDDQDAARALRDLTVEHDEGYLHVRLRVADLDPDGDGAPDWSKVRYLLAFDTVDPARGESFLDEARTIAAGRRVEFLLSIAGAAEGAVQLAVVPSYDLYGVWHGLRAEGQLHRSVASDAGRFVPMRNLINWEYVDEGEVLGPFVDDPIGTLPVGHEAERSTSNFWYGIEGSVLEVRIPWSLLHFADPSSHQVIDGDAAPRALATSTTDGVAVAAVSLGPDGTLADSLPAAVREGEVWVLPAAGFATYRWEGWESPRHHELRKASFDILQEALPALQTRWRQAP
ncbi:hypothetical protein [Vulgatibacter sp.]|uniref:hypothetical protein n=1 Tax=Vulgatibacter sp. TaxID=1971226 RepID=UPI0035694665